MKKITVQHEVNVPTLHDFDAYAWYALGANLDRAGIRPLESERAFGEAAKLESDNLRYRVRVITFLIEQARYRDAEEAFQLALTDLDPDGARSATSPDLANELFVHVVTAWLDAGEILRARTVFDLISEKWFDVGRDVKLVKWRLEDAEETDELGESVHPPGIPMDSRWKRPDELAERGPDGSALIAWYPARVVEASDDAVVLVAGVVADRRLVRIDLDADRWRSAGGWCPPEDARGYLLLARYESGHRLYPWPEPPLPWTRGDGADPLRHLRAWAEEEEAEDAATE